MAAAERLWQKWKPWWLSVAAGALIGCSYRLVLNWKFADLGVLLVTVGFLVIVPICMGYVTVDHFLRRVAREVRWFHWFFLPWLSVFIAIAVAVVMLWEGGICVIFALPIMLVSATLGGLLGRLMFRRWNNSASGRVTAIAAPLLVILIESYIPSPLEIRTVKTDILIHAPTSVVWDNIKSVRTINASELPHSWVTRIGFPKPVSATLSHDGIGGVRNASFTGGLVFTETVSQWIPQSDLQFSIRANTNAIPASTLDEHVTIGGAFFDVLQGEYVLERRPDGTLLHLTSQERLSTHLNPYAGIWTDAVMRSIQSQILEVIRRRSESREQM
jgi:hypothetical protein